MKRFTNAIQHAVEAKNWYAALSLALSLPDVCGRLEAPEQGSRERYVNWVQKWLEPAYTAHVGADYQKHVFLCADDCYALRCSYLHEGGSNLTEQRAQKVLHDFHFVTPPESGLIHMNQFNTTLQLQADIFALDMAKAVDQWAESVKDNADIQDRMQTLLIVHDIAGGFRI